MEKPPTLTVEEVQQTLPETYDLVQFLGEGGFGFVVKCRRKDTNENLAVKMPHFQQDTQLEVQLLREMMAKGLEEQNIIKFLDTFDTRLGKALVFEMLDLSLHHYLEENPMVSLNDIRLVVQQMAVALEALRTMEIIHTDIKLDNIMLCDREAYPFKIKLIDFGLAIPRNEVQQGVTIQVECYRAPEVILGLPFSEAIDMWSLGNTVASMLLDGYIFPNTTEFETLKVMLKLFGQPPTSVLDEGMRTFLYFHMVCTGWTLMTDEEYEREFSNYKVEMHYSEQFSSLDALIKDFVRDWGFDEAELDAFIDLLKQMLQMNEADRITPAQILQHPFVCNGPSWSEQSGMESSPETREEEEVHKETSSLDASSSCPEVVMEIVMPALEDNQQYVSVQSEVEKKLDPVLDQTSPSVVNVENLASTAENTSAEEEDDQDCISVQTGLEETPQILENVVPVQDQTSAPMVFNETTSLSDRDDQDGDSSVQSELENTPHTTNQASPVLTDTSASDALSSEEEEFTTETTTPPLEGNQEIVWMQSEPDPALDLNTRDDLSAVSTSGDAAKSKKKKNCLRRFYSWMRKHVSCFSANSVDD